MDVNGKKGLGNEKSMSIRGPLVFLKPEEKSTLVTVLEERY